MSDLLLQLGASPRARRLIKTLGLPLPLPRPLRRARGPGEERPLKDLDVVVGAAAGAGLIGPIAEALGPAGANPFVAGDAPAAPFDAPGAAWGRPARPLDLAALPEGLEFDGLVFDASGVAGPAELGALYGFFHPLLGRLAANGRAVVLGRPADGAATSAAAAAQAALDGFVRSLAKELGARGSTAQLVVVEPGAEPRAAGVLRFLLSARAAFISGQPLRVTARARAAASDGALVRTLERKVALVTGAARGIGEATAAALAAEGAHVVCLDRPQDDALTSRVARAIGGTVLLADLGEAEAPAQIARALAERHGGVDVVVHNAGITRDKTLAKMTPAAWDQTIDVNLAAVLRVTDALVGGGLLRDDGRVICLSSVAGLAGNVGQTSYAASKAGLIGFVRREAEALAPRGITVNAVAPGFIETRLTAAIPFAIRAVGRRLAALSQGGLPEDVAAAITFLATPAAVGLTGGVLRVCGGAFIGA